MSDTDCGSYGPCQTDPAHLYTCAKSDACLSSNYAPDVPIAPLPGVSSTVVSSLNAHAPNGFTPTYPALEGTYRYLSAWAAAHPNDETILVLATDGDPTICDAATNNVDSIAANLVAPALAGDPRILTFVVGVGVSLISLNTIAAAGGTQQARIVDTAGTAPGDQFLATIKSIQGSVLGGCRYRLPVPASGPLDPTKVTVQITPALGTVSSIKQVVGAAACTPSDGGWYYDNPVNPIKMILCDSTCFAVHNDVTTVEFVLGCPTIQ
jgi:hypothetical protein